MLEVDDDDDVFEEADAEAFEARAEAAAAASGNVSEPEDDLLQQEAPLCLEDFNLLPRVLQLLEAHKAGDGYDRALSVLRRSLARCEQGVSSWAADTAAPETSAAAAAAEQAAHASLEGTRHLLTEHAKRTREWLVEAGGEGCDSTSEVAANGSGS